MSLPTKSQRIGEESDQMPNHSNELNPENALLINGFSSIKQKMVGKHPLEALERTHKQRMDNNSYSLLKSMQGIHAPLRLMVERRAAQQIGRLPFLSSSNVMLEVLDGRDETIGFEDVLNDPTQPEVMAPPHMLIEKQLGVL